MRPRFQILGGSGDQVDFRHQRQVIGGGAILTESVYNLHGVGQLAADSIRKLDIVPILVIVMLTAFAVVILGALIDVLYAVLDPRIRLSE